MTIHERNQQKMYWLRQHQQVKERIKALDKEYIEANAAHQIGSIVTIEDFGKITTVRIKDYSISSEGLLTPSFESMEGKCVFSDRPTIIDQQ